MIGHIHSIETCGTVDGPGIRYTAFLQGCPLKCQYCHNPDSWARKSKNSTTTTVEELVDDVKKYKSYFRFSGGGVTLSGGEPLMQAQFCKEVFELCKKEGIHTTLDTSGCYVLTDTIKELLSLTDLVLLDIKSINPTTFEKVTEFKIDNTLAFAQYLHEQDIKAWVRLVYVPGLTDNVDELHQLAQYVSKLRNLERFSILPFHQLGAYKWEELNLNYQLTNTPEPTPEEAEKIRDIFRTYGLNVI